MKRELRWGWCLLSVAFRRFGSLSGAGLGASGLGVFNVEGLYQVQSIREDMEVCSLELFGVGCMKEGGRGFAYMV